MNWAVSSRSYVPLENVVQPLHTPRSVEMDSVSRRILREGSLHLVGYVQQSDRKDTPLMYLPDYFVQVPHFFIHFHRM